MSRRLDTGVASYGNPDALDQTLMGIRRLSTTDFRCLVVSNVHPDAAIHARTVDVIKTHADLDARIIPQYREDNIGYSGAVNEIFSWAETEYVAYMDNDAVPLSHGWDEQLASVLDRFHEIGMIFPNGGSCPIAHPKYVEILWGVGFCWMTPRVVATAVANDFTRSYKMDLWPKIPTRVQYFDESIGHQDEVDFQTRVRLAGYRIAALPSVSVQHRGTASSSPAQHERISKGVRNWVDKWCRYFCGADINYFSPQVMRHEDWPPSALHMERYFKSVLGENLNANPEVVRINGVEYDLIKVPRLKGFYRNRIV